MKKEQDIKGGRRHFHLILIILIFIFIPFYTPSFQTTISDSIYSINNIKKNIQIEKLYKLITQVSPIKNEDERRQLALIVYTYGTQYFIDSLLLLAIVKKQSNFQKTIMGYGNCYGYFQINLNVHKVTETFKNDINQQAQKACQILNYCKKNSNNDLIKALNLYNGSKSSKNKYGQNVLNIYNNYKQIYKGL